MAANIPLECKICPKKPDFSDVSHLLTHIASKAHLSRQYQMKVKASADASSHRLMNEYDAWYAMYGLDDLMRDRLNQKEKRGGRASNAMAATARRGSRGQSRAGRTSKSVGSGADGAHREGTTSASSRSTPNAQGGRRANRSLRDSVLNPQLDSRIKIEPESRAGSPFSGFSFDPMQLPPNFFTTAFPPAGPNFATMPYAGTPMKQELLSSSFYDDGEDASFDSEPEAPTQLVPRGRKRRRDSDDTADLYNVDPADYEIGETTSDVAKLKGLIWPGMAMFDSATPEMRRKRNQKKDYSVIEQLMATSEEVEPEEMVFDSEGRLRRQRVITGNPPDVDDDESLLSGEIEPSPEPPKKRVARRNRTALVERDRNTGRVARKRTGGSQHTAFGRSSGPYFDGAAGDEDLTYGRSRPRKRAGISIHRDNSGPDITFAQPSPFNVLTTGFRNPFQQVPANHRSQTGMPRVFHHRLPSFTYGNGSLGKAFGPGTAGGVAPTGYASFGGLNTQALFQHNPFPTSSGASALAAFQQQYGPTAQQSYTDGAMFGDLGQATEHNLLDPFAGLGHDASVDGAFQAGTEFNPLFFSSTRPTPATDEEGTISAPVSDHER
jgi:hypothetical protein